VRQRHAARIIRFAIAAAAGKQRAGKTVKEPHQDAPSGTAQGSPEDAERAFYHAFTQCDPQAMGRVWAEDGVICIHPGGTLLQGRTAVLQSWAQILTGALKPSVRIETISRFRHGDLAVHVVEEHITPGSGSSASASMILATNVFRLIDGAWYLVAHHASLPLVNTDTEQPKGVLH
jgi:uncharacterized protein (TIGR02246 family)